MIKVILIGKITINGLDINTFVSSVINLDIASFTTLTNLAIDTGLCKKVNVELSRSNISYSTD